MIAVIFEVYPHKKKYKEYLEIAAELKKDLETIEGFISIERFSSLNEEGKILSLSFWTNEAAVKEWRNLESHRAAQQKGHDGVFKNYRLRVATVNRDYGKNNRNEAPSDSAKIVGN